MGNALTIRAQPSRPSLLRMLYWSNLLFGWLYAPSSGAARHLLPEREKNKSVHDAVSSPSRGEVAEAKRRSVRGMS